MKRRVAKLGRIVRRDRCRHADGDAGRAIGQEVREGAGQDDRLLVLLVVGRAEIDRVLGDAFEQRGRDLGHARFGVAHGGGVIAVDVAEIPLPVDQRIADREILGETDQRVVDRLVAVRMELAHHLADDAGAFGETLVGIEAQEPHRVHDAPVDRLQPVAHVGQRAVHDRRQRIGEIALFQRLLQIDRLDVVTAAGSRRHKAFSHGVGLAEPVIRGKCQLRCLRLRSPALHHARFRFACRNCHMRRFSTNVPRTPSSSPVRETQLATHRIQSSFQGTHDDETPNRNSGSSPFPRFSWPSLSVPPLPRMRLPSPTGSRQRLQSKAWRSAGPM